MTIIASPCVRSCTLEPATDTCVGCGRSLTEILNWRRYSDGERNAIIEELPKRLQSLQTRCRASLITTPSGTPPDLSEIISRSFGTLAAGGSTKHR
jgi:predicted Fe-S protein YdhL (DUF1289 family)